MAMRYVYVKEDETGTPFSAWPKDKVKRVCLILVGLLLILGSSGCASPEIAQPPEATVSTLEANIAEANANNDRLEADVATQRVINSSLSEELRTVKDPKHFASLQELLDWLDQDDTDTAYASKSPTEQTFILQVRALRDGYLLPHPLSLN